MNKFTICFSGNVWYALNTNTKEFTESVTLNPDYTYITFQVSDLIRYIKSKNKKYIPNIINLESLDKQFSQSGKDIIGHAKWHILRSMRREGVINTDFKIDQIENFLQLILTYYEKLTENLQEIDRFNQFEVNVNKIIHATQLKGIKIDQEKVMSRCQELHSYLYKIKNKLQFEFNIFQPEDAESQLKYIKSKGYNIINSHKRTVNLLRYEDEICNLFYEINKTSQDLKSLVFMNARFGGIENVHPYFIGFGTITSRIIIKEPSLQNLRKTNRDLIIPSAGKKLLYIDYSQYEAGLLAHFSNDSKLLKLYNESDIYNDIVQNVIQKEINSENRKNAKILFYRFLYGDDFTSTPQHKKIVESYFNTFSKLIDFKNNLITESKNDGYTKSFFGNYRLLNNENENNWVLSHYIQSIASYIFKKSIIEVYENLKRANLLIPLHDGALYEVDIDEYPNYVTQIKRIFISNLQKVCPSLVNAKAEIKEFYKIDTLVNPSVISS